MNLTTSDFDATFELVVDEGFTEQQENFSNDILAEVDDVSQRVFQGPDRIVWSQVISFSSPNSTHFNDIAISHDMNMALWLASSSNNLCQQFGVSECKSTIGGITEMVPSTSIKDVSFGQVTYFTHIGGEADTIHAYVLTFRQTNIVIVLEVVGLLDSLEQGWVEELARTLESKIK